jgi:hypothetical protein
MLLVLASVLLLPLLDAADVLRLESMTLLLCMSSWPATNIYCCAFLGWILVAAAVLSTFRSKRTEMAST